MATVTKIIMIFGSEMDLETNKRMSISGWFLTARMMASAEGRKSRLFLIVRSIPVN